MSMLRFRVDGGLWRDGALVPVGRFFGRGLKTGFGKSGLGMLLGVPMFVPFPGDWLLDGDGHEEKRAVDHRKGGKGAAS